MIPKKLDRRQLLRAFGIGAGSLAFLPILDSHAETTGFPKRILFFFTPNGHERSQYTPGGGETDFTLKQILSPLAPYKNELLIVDGLDLGAFFASDGSAAVGNDHTPGTAMCLTGSMPAGNAASGPSLDQFIAQHLPDETTFRSLSFGVEMSTANQRSIFWKGKQDPVVSMDDPAQAAATIFAGAASEDPAALALLAERQSILAMNKSRLTALESTFTAGADREKLQAHLAGLAEIEKSLQLPASCVPPDLSGSYPNASYEKTGRKQIDVLVSALACDLTRVASLQWGGVNQSFEWLGVDAQHHKLAHFNEDGASKESMQQKLWRIGEWYSEQFAYLLARLAAVKEGDGTLLDNTIVVWCHEHNLPPGAGVHGRLNLPYLLAGGRSTGLKTGRYLNFTTGSKGQYGVSKGEPNNRLFLSLCHLMGLPQVTTFGDEWLCADGPLPGLT